MSAATAGFPDAADRLSDRHYADLTALLGGHVGIRLPPGKRTMLEGRLRKRVRALGLDTVDDYCRLIFEGGGLDDEFVHLIDAVTTNKTDFFREADHFQYLAAEAVPSLAAERPAVGPFRLKLWSAACSNGAEPYTLAMVMAELKAADPRLDFAILATDISTEMLQRAAAAVYPAEMAAPVPPELARRYLMRARDPARREVRVVPELRRAVRCRRLNLIEARYPVERDFDVVFCRNVLIYFDRATQQEVLRRLCAHLRPGGFLFLGHTESTAGSGIPGMVQAAPTIYRRR